jgi:hypothetical protein
LFQRGQGHGFLVPQHCFLAPKLQTLTTIQNCLDGSLYTVTSKLLTLSWSSRKKNFFRIPTRLALTEVYTLQTLSWCQPGLTPRALPAWSAKLYV